MWDGNYNISMKRAVSPERKLFIESASQKSRKSSMKQAGRFNLSYEHEINEQTLNIHTK